MEDCSSEDTEFEPVLVTIPFLDMKISNQYHAVCCLRAIFAFRFGFVTACVCEINMLILYIKRVISKIRQNFCMFNGPLEAHV